MKTRFASLTAVARRACQRVAAARFSVSERHVQTCLFIFGMTILVFGLSHGVEAQGLTTKYNTDRIQQAVNAIMSYLEGSFGALVMACAGIGAIMSAAFGQYRAALSLMVVAVGAFILRSIMSTFFNDDGIQQ
jgi:hypothetical protein